MKCKKLLAAFLLGVGLCSVPVLGRGEIQEWMYEGKASYIRVVLLEARVDYMMRNPNVFLDVHFYYDKTGIHGREFPKGVDTKGKIYVIVMDTRARDVFSYKSGTVLLEGFKKQLEAIYSFIDEVATDMDTDIVAGFYSKEEIPLGYFYQGEYHLWEE